MREGVWSATFAATAALLYLWRVEVSAHPLAGVGDFYAGMLHPVLTLEFVLPLIALGLLAGQQPKLTAVAMLGVTPLMLASGALVALFIRMPYSVHWVNVGSMIVLGVLVAARPPLHAVLGVLVSAVPAATIGWANGAEIGDQLAAGRFIPGVGLAGMMIVMYGAGASAGVRAPWMRIAVRVAGSWIAAVGILVFGLVR